MTSRFIRAICAVMLLIFLFTACTDNIPAENGSESITEGASDTGFDSEEETTAEETDAVTDTEPADTESTTEPATTETKAPDPEPKDPEPSDHISEDDEQVASLTEIVRIEAHTDSNGVKCRVVQGACTDGKYYYVALNDSKSSDPESVSAIRKYDISTGALVKTYEGLKIMHSNDMTVNTETGELIAVHNSPDRKMISIYDLETMTLKEKKTLTLDIYSMAYDPFEQCYWVGISYGYNFAKLDLEFNQVGDIYVGKETGYTKQGMDVDSKYIYFAQYKTNCIIVYNKEGKFIKQIDLSVQSTEAENICHVGDTFYIGYYTSSSGGRLYKAKINTVKTTEVSASMTKWQTVDQYTDGSGNLCKVTQGTCTDGTYLYMMMNNDVKSSYRSALLKIDLATGKIVATSEGFGTGITNDITYNKKTNQILVVHNSPEPKKVTVIDADTMKYVETKTLGFSIYALAYDEVLDCYWAGLSGCYDFARLDNDLKQVGETYPGYSSGYTKQGMDCDGKYLYFILSAKNSVAVYKTDGTFIGLATLSDSSNSAQNICHVGDTFYIGYNVSSAGGYIYKATFNIKD
nr:hypothetical protein [Clostridia bacterium]